MRLPDGRAPRAGALLAALAAPALLASACEGEGAGDAPGQEAPADESGQEDDGLY